MKKIIITLLSLIPAVVFAAGPKVPVDDAGIDLTDKASLQRGFKAYNQYCLGCHTLKFQRYNRAFEDLDIKEEDWDSYMLAGKKPGDHITNTMPEKDAANWFGTAPPDLTLVSRYKGTDWVYTYLRSFYVDPSRPFGVNNKVFPDVGMPHVLQGLQGVKTMDENKQLTKATGGTMTEAEYDAYVRDMVAFLDYVGEPMKLERQRLGYWVIGFLFVLFIFAFLLKKEYWRDVH